MEGSENSYSGQIAPILSIKLQSSSINGIFLQHGFRNKSTMPGMTETQALTDLIKNINAAWRENRTKDLNEYFHSSMMIVGPDGSKIAKGRKLCVQSYQQFIDAAEVHDLTLAEPEIDIWGETATAVYEFTIDYSMNGKRYKEKGRDLFTFTYIPDTGWQAVWRMIIAMAEE